MFRPNNSPVFEEATSTLSQQSVTLAIIPRTERCYSVWILVRMLYFLNNPGGLRDEGKHGRGMYPNCLVLLIDPHPFPSFFPHRKLQDDIACADGGSFSPPISVRAGRHCLRSGDPMRNFASLLVLTAICLILQTELGKLRAQTLQREPSDYTRVPVRDLEANSRAITPSL